MEQRILVLEITSWEHPELEQMSGIHLPPGLSHHVLRERGWGGVPSELTGFICPFDIGSHLRWVQDGHRVL